MSEIFEGEVIIKDARDKRVFHFDAGGAILFLGAIGNEGDLIIRDDKGRGVFNFTAGGAEGGAGSTASLCLGAKDNEGDLIIKDDRGREVFNFNAGKGGADGGAILKLGAENNEGDLIIRDDKRREVFNFSAGGARLYLGAKDNEGDLIIRDVEGREAFYFKAGGPGPAGGAILYLGTQDNEGDLIIRDGAGNERIHLDGGTGDIRLQGADCAEEFDVTDTEEVSPGTVLVIDDESTLYPCKAAYNRKVAGVVSGSNGTNPGIILDVNPTQKRRLPVALNGKVYCKVDAQYAPIEVGDLLTTSPTLGHAMKATDPIKSFGAVIGKALCPLDKGRGLIPILVALQ